MKLVSFGRRSRTAAREPLGPLEAALQPAWVDGRWRVPERFNFTRDVVEVLAEESRRRALMFLGADGVIEPWTFQRLAEGAGYWAARLREHGVRPGDRVVVLVGKTPSWIEVMLAAMKIGAVSVPSPSDMSGSALGVRVAGSGAKVVVAERVPAAETIESTGRATVLYVDESHDRLQRMSGEEPSHDTAAKDLAFLLTTSGAGGGPYGVEHSHASAFAARAQAEHWLDARKGDVVWCTADTSSPLAVWLMLLGPWARGAEIVLHDGAFDPEERLDLIRRFEVTVLCQSPGEYHALAETGERMLARYLPHRLRRMVSTGDFLSSDVVSTFEQAWGLPIEDGWLQTECGLAIGHGADDGLESGSIGHPLLGYGITILDENGAELAAGEEGQLALRGKPPMLFSGYWNAPEQTKAVFRGDLYLTGDLACREEDGSVRLLGRAPDVLTSSGRRFSPFEVEQALLGHRAVAHAGVVGVRDLQRGGQYVRAFVVLVPGAEASDRLVAEIRQQLRHSLPEERVPRDVEFVDALPTAPNGTILRSELRERTTGKIEGVWSRAPRLPGAPAPVAPDAQPVPPPRRPVLEAEDEGPLPDFVVPRSKTYAAALAGLDVETSSEPEPEEQELPDYVVVPELVVEPLPEHVVSFLNAPPLPDVPMPPEPKTEPRPEPRTVPILKEMPAAHAPAPAPVAKAEASAKPKTRPIREPEPLVRATPAPEPAPKAEPAAPPVAPPPPPPAPPKEPAPVPVAEKPRQPTPKPKPEPKPRPKPAAKPAKKVLPKPAPAPRARVSEPPPPAEPPAPKPEPQTMPEPQVVPAPPAPDPIPEPPKPEPPAPPAPGAPEPKRRARRKRKEKKPEPVAKRVAQTESAPEPGMEDPDLDFIKTLSTRLDAYSVSVDKTERS